MGRGHHRHHRGRDHDHTEATALPAAFDITVPDEALTPEQSRRSLMRRAGLLGAELVTT
ncbi:hypothetical protein [Streptomyces sp. P17]|uniref:hypothetical protein n=1 Tax=Streptomyces sp. P17 TaxID=3074716 RepID=UPI0028F44F1B|nr:hypothetical protein [Streptomyces sp. P17]MDT9698934.1 hypothetical protein [Streptomyces sp. P17]